MGSVIINIKAPKQVKEEAQKISSELGLSLSAVINAFLRQLIRNRTVSFSLNEGDPSDFLLKSIKDSELERKLGKQRHFRDNNEALEFLDKI